MALTPLPSAHNAFCNLPKQLAMLASAAFCSRKETLLAKQELKGSNDVCRLVK